jgi:hypothetical protein
MWTKLLGIISVDFDIIDELLNRYSAFIQYQRRNGNMVQYISYFVEFEKAYDLGEMYCTVFSLNLV